MCLIAPRNPHTDIGVAEGSGTKTYCASHLSIFTLTVANFPPPRLISFFVQSIPTLHIKNKKTKGTAQARYDKANQGQLPADFFSDAKYVSYKGPSGGEIRQITGCIRASHLSRLNPSDGGGQFDSSGQGYVLVWHACNFRHAIYTRYRC